jgi:RNA polymerase sigma-70 factor (ECF subfamily)
VKKSDALGDRTLAWEQLVMIDRPNCEGQLRTRAELADATDLELVQQLGFGNGEALAVMIDRYQRLVFSIAMRIVKDSGEAEDLVQGVFLEIYRKLKLFDAAKGTFKVWLLRYAYTRSMNRRDLLENRKFYSTVCLEEASTPAIPSRDLSRKTLTVYESARFVKQALDMLRPKQRKTIELVALQGLTFQEAASVLGDSVPATKNYYYRGMTALRNMVSDRVSAAEPCEQQVSVVNAKFEVPNLKARTA